MQKRMLLILLLALVQFSAVDCLPCNIPGTLLEPLMRTSADSLPAVRPDLVIWKQLLICEQMTADAVALLALRFSSASDRLAET